MKAIRAKKGQNTAEYIVLLVLVAVGGISMFSMFSRSIKSTMANSIAALTGQVTTTMDQVSMDRVNTEAKKGSTMTINDQEVKRFEDNN